MKSTVLIMAFGLSLTSAFAQPAPNLLDQYRKDLDANPRSSLAHFRIAEILRQQGNNQAAANEFREALSGDLQPRWIEVWAHIGLARIYDITGQFDRSDNEYRMAMLTADDTARALQEASQRLESPDSFPPSFARNAPSDLLSRIDPEYSDEARVAELEGTVLITASAIKNGVATDLRVTKSLGLGLDEKAIEAVRRWRFQPGESAITAEVDFSFPLKQSRWHLIGANFRPAEGVSRPIVMNVYYPPGAGVFGFAAIEQGQLLGAMGRQSFISLSFEVDVKGVPQKIQVQRSSESVWNDQAIALLAKWRFMPGLKDGIPVTVPCAFDFAWGPRSLGSRDVSRLVSALNPPPSLKDDPWHPEAIYTPEPQYPAENRGLEGTVTAMVMVKPDGTPQSVQVLSGLEKSVDARVTDTVREWRFQPRILNGRAVFGLLQVEVSFQPPGQVQSKIVEFDPPKVGMQR